MNAVRVIDGVAGLAAVGALVAAWWIRRQLRALGAVRTRWSRPVLAGWPAAAATMVPAALLAATTPWRAVSLALACGSAVLWLAVVVVEVRELRRQRRLAAAVARWCARRSCDE